MDLLRSRPPYYNIINNIINKYPRGCLYLKGVQFLHLNLNLNTGFRSCRWVSLKSPSVFTTLNNLFCKAGTVSYKRVNDHDIRISWAPAPGALPWLGILRISTGIQGIGVATLQIHGLGAGGVAGPQVNWPPNAAVPFVLNDRGVAPGPPVAPFPIVQNWMWQFIPGPSPVMNIVVHAHDYCIDAVAGFSIVSTAGASYQHLWIINQLQSALSMI